MGVRALILAAGEGTRWGDYLGVPKHLLTIQGWRLLDRTVHQFSTWADVTVIGPDDRYRVDGADLHTPDDLTPTGTGADKFLSSADLWNRDGQTILVYGDVWFSGAAVEQIGQARPLWWLFARHGRSAWTGGYGECFAVSFAPQMHEPFRERLGWIAELRRSGRIDRAGGWEAWRAMRSLPPEAVAVHEPDAPLDMRSEIDDWTDDFDTPDDYHRWIERWGILHDVPCPHCGRTAL